MAYIYLLFVSGGNHMQGRAAAGSICLFTFTCICHRIMETILYRHVEIAVAVLCFKIPSSFVICYVITELSLECLWYSVAYIRLKLMNDSLMFRGHIPVTTMMHHYLVLVLCVKAVYGEDIHKDGIMDGNL